MTHEQETKTPPTRPARVHPPIGRLIALSVCVVLFLLSGLHAYLARTTALAEFPLPLLSLPVLLFLIGLGLSLYFLVNPSRRWPVWFRVAGMVALVMLAQGAGIWFLAASRTPYRLGPSELKAECLSNMSALAKALNLYAADQGAFPPADSWSEAASQQVDQHLKTRMKDLLQCPSASTAPSGYAYNSALGQTMYDALDTAADTIIIFESDAHRNAAGGPELLPDVPRHFGGDNCGFADGHVQWLPRRKLGTEKHGHPIWAKEPDADWVIWNPVLKQPTAEAK